MWCLSPTLLLRAATCSMLTCFMLRPKFWALDQAQGLCQPVSRSGCLPGRCIQGYGLTHGAALASAIRGWHITTDWHFGLGRSIPRCLSLPKEAPLQLGAAEAAATRPNPSGQRCSHRQPRAAAFPSPPAPGKGTAAPVPSGAAPQRTHQQKQPWGAVGAPQRPRWLSDQSQRNFAEVTPKGVSSRVGGAREIKGGVMRAGRAGRGELLPQVIFLEEF